ncbi:MAG: caspase family protein [Treponema sp.]|jgi:hypothetical protein|nr:caspase family protein [Treponema sp.]
MKKHLIVTALLVSAFLALGAQQRHALVIGNSAYTAIGRLNNPANDAADIKAALENLGFQVDLVLDGTLAQMEEGVVRLKRRLSQESHAYGFFFYAGHGVQSQGENYLIPVDAEINSESFLRSKALAVQAALDEMQDAGNELNMVVLDACRNNPFSWARSGSRGLTVTGRQPPGSIIVYATSVGATAEDGAGRNGLFTGQLLNHLKTPGLEVKEIFNRTGADVQRISGNAQIPAIYSQFFDTAYLSAVPSQPPVQPVTPSAPTAPPRPAPPAQPADPFTQGRWEALFSYQDREGNAHSDHYEIIFVKTGVCIITIRTKENGVDLYQDGDGLWSYDDTFLRIECDFPNPAIRGLPRIDWTSLYQFDGNRTRFTLLVPPFSGAARNIRASFIQTQDE